jgi:8-oxo-dGTP diphosphatase
MTRTGTVDAVARQGHRPPKGYQVGEYPTFAVTVDNVILTIVDGRLHVLLVQRQTDPYAGAWALPGGFKRPDEALDEAAARELAEETGIAAPAHLGQLGAYGDPDRDPRTNVVTVAYLAVAAEVGPITAGSDAANARLWPVADALDSLALAFDHRRILADAIERAAEQLEHTDLAIAFVGETFTLSELQNVYEELWGTEIDAANFQRAMRGTARPTPGTATYVEATGERARSTARGGRPPELYRPGPAWEHEPPIRRPRTGRAAERGRA